jgi:hypothetical protein
MLPVSGESTPLTLASSFGKDKENSATVGTNKDNRRRRMTRFMKRNNNNKKQRIIIIY